MSTQGGERYDLYLLIHPEASISNDMSALVGGYRPGDENALVPIGGFYESEFAEREVDLDGRHADLVRRAMGCADRHAVVLDDPLFFYADDNDGLEEDAEVISGIPAAGWLIGDIDAFGVAEEAVRLAQQARAGTVLLGGYARGDCVQRSVAALGRAGIHVTLDEPTTMPLNDAGIAAWLKPDPTATAT